MIRLLAVGTAHPVVIETVGALKLDGVFTLADRSVPGARSPIRAAEQIVGFRIICIRCDTRIEARDRAVDFTRGQKFLRRICERQTTANDQHEEKGKNSHSY